MLKRKEAITMVTIAVVSFFIGTMFSVAVATDGGNPFDKIWEVLHDHQSRMENLEARIRALETLTRITIEAYPTTDFYLRYHGLSIDEPLPDNWWLYDDYNIRTIGSTFTYEKTVVLEYGSHYVEYAASCYPPDYAWHVRIYINGVLKAEGDVGRYYHLRAYFDVGS